MKFNVKKTKRMKILLNEERLKDIDRCIGKWWSR